MKCSFKEIIRKDKEFYRGKPLSQRDKMTEFFYRYISNVLLWIFLNLGISANGVGLIMASISIIAAGLFLTGIKINLIIGSILFIIAMILDHTDGDVARITKTFSKKGIFLDHIHHTCEELFTFIGLGIYLTFVKSNINFFIIGILITILMLIPNYFRATIFWFLKKEGYYDMKYRKMPFVFLYGDFFKILHFLILLSLLFDIGEHLIILVLIWSIVRFFPKMYIYYKECGVYDKKNN